MSGYKETGLLNATDELRKLILENPELPLLVLAGQRSNTGSYAYMSCSIVKAEIGKFLDCANVFNRKQCFTDRNELEVTILYYSDFKGTYKEFLDYVKSEMERYEPYWKPCIIVRVDN